MQKKRAITTYWRDAFKHGIAMKKGHTMTMPSMKQCLRPLKWIFRLFNTYGIQVETLK